MKNLFYGNKQIPSGLYSKLSIKTIKNKLLALFVLPLLFCMISNYAEAQCNNISAVLNGNGPLVSNKINATQQNYFCSPSSGGSSMAVGQSVFDPFDPAAPSMPAAGEFTVNFTQPTGLITFRLYALNNRPTGKEYIEIWLNDTLIDLSTFTGVTIDTNSCPANLPAGVADAVPTITTASNLEYPNKAGVLISPTTNSIAKGTVTIDLASYGLAASKFTYKNKHALGDGLGTRVEVKWCTDVSLYPSNISNPTITCQAGSVAPALSSSSLSNSCPSSTADLTTISASNMPANTSLTWHTATPATNANKVTGTAVNAGTYYAAFYDATNDCYSGTNGSATSAVTASINSCVTQCTNASAPLNGNGPLVTNKMNAKYVSYGFCGFNAGGGGYLSVGETYVDPFDPVITYPLDGEFTLNFPNPTGFIELHINSMGVDEYVEIWLNDSLIDLSIFPGVTLSQTSFCNQTTPTAIAISTSTNMGIANQSGVLHVPINSSGYGQGTLTIDLAAHGLGASKLRYRNIHPINDGYGTAVQASWCNDTLPYPARLTNPCAAVGTNMPALSSSSATINCTSLVADLSSITASNTPSGTSVTYHTALPATDTNKVTANSVGQGTYYAVFYDATAMCYGTANAQVNVSNNCPCTAAGSNSPALSASSLSNTCPTATADLTTITASNMPTNTSLTWHTATPVNNSNKIAGTSVTNSGTYHAAFYDATNDCYSGLGGDATDSVVVTITACCLSGNMAPALSANTATNVCPATTTDLTAITASNMPASTTLTWHTATPATNANKVTGTAVSAGTYYAAFYDSTLDCYSGTAGSATSAVTVTQSNCCAAGSVAPTVN